MSRYSLHGKGHRMLARLALAPAGHFELLRAAAPRATARKRQKLWRLVQALRDDGLAVLAGDDGYILTPAGADALACLDAGHEVALGAQAPPLDAAA